MNAHDKKIIKFILTADKESLTNWFNSSSVDDVEYAASLLCAHLQDIQAKLSLYLNLVDNVDEAEVLLRKYRL
jgi:hypothetical protein